MKKTITFILLLTGTLIFSQQVARQKVILEVATGTWCGACPSVVQIIHDLETADANIAVIEYHTSDSYENSDSSIRNVYYDFEWYPTTFYDATRIEIDDWATYSVHYSTYETRNNTPSSFSLLISGDYESSTISGTVTAEKVATYPGTNLVLHMAITESDIPENWQGETELDYVERLMFPNGNGTTIDFSAKNTVEVPFSIDIDASWVADNCNLVYFIQDNDTKEILQGDQVKVTEIINLSNDDYSVTNNSYIYPNPIHDYLNIYADDTSTIRDIKLFDLKGSLVFEQESYSEKIKLQHLPQGVYILYYTDDTFKVAKKMVKK